MADLDLDAIEARHWHDEDMRMCSLCMFEWPCDAVRLVAEVRRLRAIIRKARPRVVQPHMDGGAHLGFTSCVVTSDELTAVLRAELEADRG